MSRTYANRPAQTTRGGRGRAPATDVARDQINTTARGRAGQTSTRGTTRGYSNTRSQNARGIAGRGRSAIVPGRTDDTPNAGAGSLRRNMDDAPETSPNQRQSEETIQDRTEMRGSYTMIRPNEEKRNAIKNQASREEVAYQTYKNQRKLQSVSCGGTVGGDQVNEVDVRQKSQQQHTRTPHDVHRKSQQYKANQKSREEHEYDQKKLDQRKKTEENERRQAIRKEHLQQEHRRANNAFLDRLEKQNRDAIGKKILSSTAAKSYQPDTKDVDESQDNLQYSSADSFRDQSSDGATSDWRESEVTSPPIATDSLTQLISAYPDVQPEILYQILESCNGDLEKAMELLFLN